MPKINVYLPDDLAAAVRAAGFPVSPVCQQALADAVQRVGPTRRAIDTIRAADFRPERLTALGTRLGERMTDRLTHALYLAGQAGTGPVDTPQLLAGLLDEGGNLAVRMLAALDVDVDALRADLGPVAEAPVEIPAGPVWERLTAVLWERLRPAAWEAVAATLETVISFAHNYVGCEHLLLGLLADPDGGAAAALRPYGVDAADARRTLTATLAGFSHARAATAQPAPDPLTEVLRRLDALETRVAALNA
jgi:ATP-dependent Clp protease ATP-binding subunit ClpA